MPVCLLVEDNRLNRKLMRDILAMRFDVLAAASGTEALQLLTQHDASIVFLDLQLPDMDGLKLLKLLKSSRHTADIPVVVISAHAMADTIQTALQCGCDEYVTKPITEDFPAFVERMARLAEDPVGRPVTA